VIAYNLNAVKANTELATEINITFNLITSDRCGINAVIPSIIQASDYTPDAEKHFLVTFRLDFASRVIVFEYDEALNPASIDILRVGLQSVALRPVKEMFTFSQRVHNQLHFCFN